jgi:hypothetical protein
MADKGVMIELHTTRKCNQLLILTASSLTKQPLPTTEQEDGWDLKTVWTGGKEKNPYP